MDATKFTSPEEIIDEVATVVAERLLNSTPEDEIPHIRESLKASLSRIFLVTCTAHEIIWEESKNSGNQLFDFHGISKKVYDQFQENGLSLSQSDITDRLIMSCVHLTDAFFLPLLQKRLCDAEGKVLIVPCSRKLN